MPRPKGTPKTGGRKKGEPNKVSTGVKANIVQVFKDMGGVSAMKNWAKENPTEFYKHYIKLLPTEIQADVDANLTVEILRHGAPD